MKFCSTKRLNTSANVPIGALAIPNGTTVYSEGINVIHNVGFLTFLFNEAHAGGTGSVNISLQYSFDNVNWYAMYTSAAGALTVDPDVVDALANEIRMISFEARMAPYLRLAIVANADSVLTADIAFQDEA